MIKIGINGLGRIGRIALRASLLKDNVQVVAINDMLDVDYLAYLIQYDSTHGRFKGTVEVENKDLIINGKRVRVTSKQNPEEIRWNEVDVDYVIESTGLFTNKKDAQKHIKAGAKKVVISAPSEDAKMFVMGVNHTELTKDEAIFSNASCTTNCLAPIIKVVDAKFGFKQGLMTTVHCVTSSQNLVDGGNKNKRRGRSPLNNIIPTSTSASDAVIKVLPDLKGKLTGMAFRVPVTNVSLLDITFTTEKNTSLKEILKTLENASKNDLHGVLGYTEDEVVSQDFLSETRTSVVDAKACLETENNFFKIIAWYDNEYGYSTKIIDLIEYSASL